MAWTSADEKAWAWVVVSPSISAVVIPLMALMDRDGSFVPDVPARAENSVVVRPPI